MLKRIVPDGIWYVLLSRLMKTNTNRQEFRERHCCSPSPYSVCELG